MQFQRRSLNQPVEVQVNAGRTITSSKRPPRRMAVSAWGETGCSGALCRGRLASFMSPPIDLVNTLDSVLGVRVVVDVQLLGECGGLARRDVRPLVGDMLVRLDRNRGGFWLLLLRHNEPLLSGVA